ncbi:MULTISPECIES: excalibur calcium-binding domain-containing protein [Streptomyces]|uniref:excalibur calcium-binding domain-containing protein n=1 Tax=Streptomyces TaxID=1883 RepID=UPI0022489819|nr:excalibur calcium-binding domain-containing protein [Streptomyces sp. JHD 1]MCX2969127.1 excalibur calcium-binding domain-containing protein [Streptomyces sp. JHD 1]
MTQQPDARPMRRRPGFWTAIGVTFLLALAGGAALAGDGEERADGREPTAAGAVATGAAPTVTATVTAEPTAPPAPEVTVTEEVEVRVTETVTVEAVPVDAGGVGGSSGGSTGGSTGGGSGDGGSGGGGGGNTFFYENCAAARAAGAAPVHRGDAGYGPHLDRDGDGTGCE